MCVIFLFVSVIILFVYDCDRYGTAAMAGEELLTIYGAFNYFKYEIFKRVT